MVRSSAKTVAIILLVAWISTLTILIPPPWVAGSWLSWSMAAFLVSLGVLAALIALTKNGRWTFGMATMSVVFLLYWLSEHLLAIRSVADSFASVLHASAYLEGFPRLVVIQTQIVLPAVHAICLVWLALFRGKPGYQS